ncbi:MAG: crossover junction endodeoxyribonuclease RuvC [Patescibacteria group bacterium]
MNITYNQSQTILSVDPGYERLGIAVLVKNEKGTINILHSECFKTSSKEEFPDRLVQLGKRLSEIIEKFKPTTMAIENLFMQTNQKTVMKVSEARGVLLYTARVFKLSIHELTPLQIKSAVTGSGRSDKIAVQKMIMLLLPEIKNKVKAIDDEYDALACGLAYFALEKSL